MAHVAEGCDNTVNRIAVSSQKQVFAGRLYRLNQHASRSQERVVSTQIKEGVTSELTRVFD